MEDDLTWLARNVHELPGFATHIAKGAIQPYLVAKFNVDIVHFEGVVYFRKDQWASRRAELQNKPSWEDAPEWAQWVAQHESGYWGWGSGVANATDLTWAADAPGPQFVGKMQWSGCAGEVLGDWRDTLERRPDPEPEFVQFVGIEEEGDRKVDLGAGWFERGDLPPVGTECEAVAEGVKAEKCKIIAYHKQQVAVQWAHLNDGCLDVLEMPGWAFRPLGEDRDKAIEEMKRHCPYHGSWDNVGRIYAGALYDAGYRKQEGKA